MVSLEWAFGLEAMAVMVVVVILRTGKESFQVWVADKALSHSSCELFKAAVAMKAEGLLSCCVIDRRLRESGRPIA